MKKKFFEEPEMELVRFNAKDAFIATSGEGKDGFNDAQEEEQEEEEPDA